MEWKELWIGRDEAMFRVSLTFYVSQITGQLARALARRLLPFRGRDSRSWEGVVGEGQPASSGRRTFRASSVGVSNLRAQSAGAVRPHPWA